MPISQNSLPVLSNTGFTWISYLKSSFSKSANTEHVTETDESVYSVYLLMQTQTEYITLCHVHTHMQPQSWRGRLEQDICTLFLFLIYKCQSNYLPAPWILVSESVAWMSELIWSQDGEMNSRWLSNKGQSLRQQTTGSQTPKIPCHRLCCFPRET